MSTVVLVARREFRERLRSKAFWIGNALLLVILVVAIAVAAFLGRDTGPPRVAAVGAQAQAVLDTAVALSPPGDPDLRAVREPTVGAARDAVREGRVDAALTDGRTVVVTDTLPGGLGASLDSARRVVAVTGALEAAGVPPAEQRAALDPPPLAVEATDPEGAVDLDADVAVGVVAGFALYGLLITYGQQVAQGVVEEKQSRVIEVLLATVRPVPLLAGKVVGLGLLGLVQVLTLAAVGLAGAALTGVVDVSASTVGTLALVVAWYGLGFALYSTLCALAGSLVSRVEDLQSTMTPVIFLLVGSLLLVQFSFNDLRGGVSLFSGLFPFSAPLAEPLRQAAGVASLAEVAGSVVLTLAAIALLVPLAARAYAGTALRTRGKTGLREAISGPDA